MIDFHPDIAKFRSDYSSLCQKYNIPMHNKSAMFYSMASKLKDTSPDSKDNNDLRQLLFIALSDVGVLLSHFCKQECEYAKYEYKQLKNNYIKLIEYYDKTKINSNLWNSILLINKLPKINTDFTNDEERFKEEANFLTFLYLNTLEISQTNSHELYNNLRRFLYMAQKLPEYRSILPLFIFQLMTRHTKRLAEQEDLNISLKSLWSFRKYKIYYDNDKNFAQYAQFSKLFRKLCKFFKDYSGVDIELCKYGFRKVSNLYIWINDKHPKKKKILDKYSYFLFNADMSCVDICESELYDSEKLFCISEKDVQNYYEKHFDDAVQFSDIIQVYLFEHAEYLVKWMDAYYVDIHTLENLTNQIYNECIIKLPKAKEWMENCIKDQIYSNIIHFLDDEIKATVMSVLDI